MKYNSPITSKYNLIDIGAQSTTTAIHNWELKTDSNGTHFRLWSPEAEAIKIFLYTSGSKTPPVEQINMRADASGMWSASIDRQLYGMFYAFQIKYNGKWQKTTPGIWAKAIGINGERAAIIDISTTNPIGWEYDRSPILATYADAIIYEMHHRDFSMHQSSGIINKGKFLALTETDTKSPLGDKTGIDHLKELGITHVQILPSFDFNSVDESNPNVYNWGYDPSNYNVPEGSYSTQPTNPVSRIMEMKQMIMSLHEAGIGVIMDVVYNHTANIGDSNFTLTAPGYFYRKDDDGVHSNASGCGNETASERQQMRNFIIHSTEYWAREFHIDGFRFDLMGIHDIETMNLVTANLKKINPHIMIYGEGWTASDSPLPSHLRAIKDNVSQLPDIAVFSDNFRDAIKGHFAIVSDRGFVTGKSGMEEDIKIGIIASTNHPQIDYSKAVNNQCPYASAPTQIINYVSCHDDFTLTDKLAKSIPHLSEAERLRAAKLAQTIVLTSQGIPFIFAGEEIFRDKKGFHNTYNLPDSINAIDWINKHTYANQFQYYRELIKLRKNHPAFRMTTSEDIYRHIVFDNLPYPNFISYSIINNANNDVWNEIKVIFNGSKRTVTVEIPKCKWIVISENGEIKADGLRMSSGGRQRIPPISALILSKK